MKRLIAITCLLTVFFGGLVSAWASCKQGSITFDGHHVASIPDDPHDRFPGSEHDQSHQTGIHCPIDEFVPTASFSPKPKREAKHVLDPLGAELAFRFSDHERSSALRGASDLVKAGTVPFHLLLSVLRI